MSENFWTTTSGAPIDPAFDKAFVDMPSAILVPNGTKAMATIHKFETVEFVKGDKPIYQLTWKLINTKYAGVLIRQRLDVFGVQQNSKPEKVDRAKATLALLFKMHGIPAPKGAPSQQTLDLFKGKTSGILVLEYETLGKDGQIMKGNWVNGIYPAQGFESLEGQYMQSRLAPAAVTQPKESFESVEVPAAEAEDEDVPF